MSFEEVLNKVKNRPMALERLLGLLGDEIHCLLVLHRLYLASDDVELQRHGRSVEGIPDDLLNACRQFSTLSDVLCICTLCILTFAWKQIRRPHHPQDDQGCNHLGTCCSESHRPIAQRALQCRKDCSVLHVRGCSILEEPAARHHHNETSIGRTQGICRFKPRPRV